MKRILLSLSILLVLSSCSSQKDTEKPEVNSVYYEIFVGSFYDSDEDGMGDLKGVQTKLDYIQNDLQATGIWLMPINPSPTYHKYDVMDYTGIDPQYGTMEDFDDLVAEMNSRDMDLILDFVLNHTSTKHPWFIKAKEAMLNDECDVVIECDFYNFSSTYKGRYHRINDNLFYEAGFWSEMPDLNLDNEVVRENILTSAKFWLDKGVKGFRLDATTHFYDDSLENNIEFLRWFNDEIKAYKPDSYLVGEAWTSESIITEMYSSGIDSFFNFSTSQQDGRVVRALRSGNGNSLSKYVESYQSNIKDANKDSIDAVFLSNHDNNRSAGYLIKPEDKRMAASIYLLMPGNPFIYYGEEVEMKGSGIDENKRLPIIWSHKDKTGQTKGPVDATYKQENQLSVEDALRDKNSLLNHYKSIIKIRNAYPDISRGQYEALDLGHDALYGSRQNKTIVVHNLSDESIEFEMDNKKVVKVSGKFKVKGSSIKIEGKSSIIIEE